MYLKFVPVSKVSVPLPTEKGWLLAHPMLLACMHVCCNRDCIGTRDRLLLINIRNKVTGINNEITTWLDTCAFPINLKANRKFTVNRMSICVRTGKY